MLVDFVPIVYFSLSCLENLFAGLRKTGAGTVFPISCAKHRHFYLSKSVKYFVKILVFFFYFRILRFIEQCLPYLIALTQPERIYITT
jgi:hypothetical protein